MYFRKTCYSKLRTCALRVIQCWNEYVKGPSTKGITKYSLKERIPMTLIWRDVSLGCFYHFCYLWFKVSWPKALSNQIYLLNYQLFLPHAFIINKVPWQWIVTLLPVWRNFSSWWLFFGMEVSNGFFCALTKNFVCFHSFCVPNTEQSFCSFLLSFLDVCQISEES